MKFLVDNALSPLVAEGLRQARHETFHTGLHEDADRAHDGKTYSLCHLSHDHVVGQDELALG